MGESLTKGITRQLLAPADRAAGTYESDDYWFPKGGGLVVKIGISAVAAGGVITTVRIKDLSGEVLAEFGALTLGVGNHSVRMATGAARPAGTNAYDGAAEDVPPVTGRVEVVVGTNNVTFGLKVQCV